MRAWPLAIVAALSGCGGGGESPPSAVPVAPETPPGIVEVPAANVTGRFHLGALGRPAAGYEIWLVDQTEAAFTPYPLDTGGGLDIPLKTFVEGHLYTMHLVREFRFFGDVDLAPATAGTQQGFVYRGGYGFDLGDVVVKTLADGEVDVQGLNLGGAIGGGFSLNATQGMSLDQYPLPAGLASFGVAGQLAVLDPATVLYAFYLRDANPALYSQELAAATRIGFRAVESAAETVTRIFATDGGPWLKGARVAGAATARFGDGLPWSDFSYDVKLVAPLTYATSVYTGSRLESRPLVVFRVQPDSGPQVVVPRVAARMLGMLPKVTSVVLTGTAATAVDYASATAANGLTRPFCQRTGVTLNVAPPLDSDLAAVPAGVFDRAEVRLDYFGQADGRASALEPALSDYPASYQVAVSGAAAAGVTRAWDPTTKILSFAFDATASAAATQSLVIPAQLFLDAVGSAGVLKVRLRVSYMSSTEAVEAGTVVWLQHNGC